MIKLLLRKFKSLFKRRDDGEIPRLSHEDPLLWTKGIGNHSCGQFSMAVVQANSIIEDQSQVETGNGITFVGVYDGHGDSPEASTYVLNNIFLRFRETVQDAGKISEDVIQKAFALTEQGFLGIVGQKFADDPLIAARGTCCVVGVFWKRMLYVANVGDSRAVRGYINQETGKIAADQITMDHNASSVLIREELRNRFPNDETIVVAVKGVHRIKGKIQVWPLSFHTYQSLEQCLLVIGTLLYIYIQVSRAIGDAYFKDPQYYISNQFPKYHLQQPIKEGVLSAVPEMHTSVIRFYDKFIIFASDGLWDLMSSQEAVAYVHTQVQSHSGRAGVAKNLAKEAVRKAARRLKMSYDDLIEVPAGAGLQGRRARHDDITIVVVFLDQDLLMNNETAAAIPQLSVHGYRNEVQHSDFTPFIGLP